MLIEELDEKKDTYEEPKGVADDDHLTCTDLQKQRISIGIDQVICGRLKGAVLKEIFRIARQQKLLCTNVGQRISKSLIRVAATRIFADPTQSILELPVNSIDSYRELNKTSQLGSVGKFGLGFFSILYWVVDNPSRYLIIESRYLDEVTGEFCAWNARILYDSTNNLNRRSGLSSSKLKGEDRNKHSFRDGYGYFYICGSRKLSTEYIEIARYPRCPGYFDDI